MGTCVLDCSVTMSWAFKEEFSPFTQGLLAALPEGQAIVPPIWPLEVANVLLVAERGGRMPQVDSLRFIDLLESLPISVEASLERRLLDDVLPLARETGLTVYDASYLELAGRIGLPLATLDTKLQHAAQRVGVRLLS